MTEPLDARNPESTSLAVAEHPVSAAGPGESAARHGRPLERRQPASRPASAPEVAIGPKQILHALRRRWIAIFVLGVPITLAAMYAVWKLYPTPFTASAVLRFSATEPRLVFDTAENPPDFHTYRSTQMDMIRSRLVLNHVLQRPEVAALPMVQAQPFPLIWLESELKLEGLDSPEFLKVSFSGADPHAVATIANAVADSYLEKVVNAEKLERAERLANLERIFRETSKAVEEKEQHVRKLAETLGSGDSRTLTIKQQMASEYFAQLRREHARVRFELMRAQVDAQTDLDLELDETGSGTGTDVPRLPESRGSNARQLDPETIVLGKRIAELQALIDRYRKTVVPGSYAGIDEYQAELDRLVEIWKRRIAVIPDGSSVDATDPTALPLPGVSRSPQSRVAMLARQERLLREEAERLGEMLKDMGASTFDLEDVQDELRQESQVSNRLKSEIETLRIELQSPSRATISERAVPPRIVNRSKKKKMTLAAGVGVFGLIFGLLAGWDLLCRRVADADEVAAQSGLSILGQFPKANNLLSRWNPGADRWPGPIGEAADSVRAVLSDRLNDVRHISVLVTGAASRDGATTLACQLARSWARSGKRTLLVDANLRRPAIHEAFQIRSEPGLSDLLRGEADMIDAASLTGQDRLWLLPAGAISDDALRRLTSDDARNIWQKLTRHFDVVIVDAPAVLDATETSFMARSLQSTVIAVRRDQTRNPDVQLAVQRLQQLNAPVAGAVLLEAGGRGL